MIIDVHTHIYNEDDYKNYFRKSKGKVSKVLVMGYSKNYFPNIKSKIMFGTDYGGEDTPLREINPYINLVKKVFSKKEQDSVFYQLAEKVYFS